MSLSTAGSGRYIGDSVMDPTTFGDLWSSFCRVRCRATSDGDYCVMNTVSGADNTECGINVSSGEGRCYIAWGTGNNTYGGGIRLGTWHDFAFMRAPGDTVLLFVDGKLQVATTITDGVHGEYRWGAGSGGGSLAIFNGELADLRVWGGPARPDQLVREGLYDRPVRTANLLTWIPAKGSSLREAVGSHTWNMGGGTITTGPDPAPRWPGLAPVGKAAAAAPSTRNRGAFFFAAA